MGKKIFLKAIALLIALCILTNWNLVLDGPGSILGIEFGQKAQAVSTGTFRFPRQTFEIQKSVTYGEDGPVADNVTGTFWASGTMNIDNNRVYGSITIGYTLKEANKYNTFEYTDIIINNRSTGISEYGHPNREIYDLNTTSGKPRNSTTGSCTMDFDYYLNETYQSNDQLSYTIVTSFCSTRDYHDGTGSIAQEYLLLADDKELILNNSPVINSTSPSQNQTLHGDINPSMTVSDPNGDILTCKYYVDSTLMDTKQTSNTATPQLVPFNGLNTKTLSNGYHALKFEVSDGKTTPVSSSYNVYIDNAPPVLSGVNAVPNDTTIIISGSAADDTTDANSILYNYTIEGYSTGWIPDKNWTFAQLSPDTEYNVRFEAMDKFGNIAADNRTVRTKAQVPVLSRGIVYKDYADIQISDLNPPATVQYMLMTGASYVNSYGELTTSPQWIKLPDNKKITVKGLSPNTLYSFTATAKNSLGIETAVSTALPVTTLALAPANLRLEKGSSQIKAIWQAVDKAVGYDLDADGKVFDTGLSPSYIHKDLLPETTHSYRVRVRNAGGAGEWSSYVNGTTLPNPPDTPSLTLESTTQTAITINWDPVAKATGYVIMADGAEIPMGTNTTFTHEGLQPDTVHKYSVSAKNAGGSSQWSNILEVRTRPAPPEAPKNLEGKPTRTNVTLSWSPAERAESYEIDIDGNMTKSIKELIYVHDGLSTQSVHTYRIRAVNAGGKSKWSEPVTVTTWPEIPQSPTNIIATAEQESITLTWYNVPLSDSYEVEIDGKATANVRENSYTSKGLEPGTKHAYKIRAKNISGNGEWSKPVEISTLPGEEVTSPIGTDILSNIIAVVTNRTITISWQAVELEAQYEIEVDGEILDSGKETDFNHTGLKPSTFHTYKVRTKDKNGNGRWCAVLALSTLPDSPDAPKNLSATATQTQIELKWDREEEISYDVEIDGRVVDTGKEAAYIDENLIPGTSHTYRVRGKNITGVTAWSDAITKSTTSPSYEVDCTKGQEFDFLMMASNVQDFSDMRFVVTYDTDQLEAVDLCELTPVCETTSCKITGTNITVKFTSGRIEFTADESVAAGTTWAGEVSTIVFRSKVDGKASINFSIE